MSKKDEIRRWLTTPGNQPLLSRPWHDIGLDQSSGIQSVLKILYYPQLLLVRGAVRLLEKHAERKFRENPSAEDIALGDRYYRAGMAQARDRAPYQQKYVDSTQIDRLINGENPQGVNEWSKGKRAYLRSRAEEGYKEFQDPEQQKVAREERAAARQEAELNAQWEAFWDMWRNAGTVRARAEFDPDAPDLGYGDFNFHDEVMRSDWVTQLEGEELARVIREAREAYDQQWSAQQLDHQQEVSWDMWRNAGAEQARAEFDPDADRYGYQGYDCTDEVMSSDWASELTQDELNRAIDEYTTSYESQWTAQHTAHVARLRGEEIAAGPPAAPDPAPIR